MTTRMTLMLGLVCTGIVLAGCDATQKQLPPIEASFPLASGLTIGPSTGLTPGASLTGSLIPVGPLCDIPTEAELNAIVDQSVGEVAAPFVAVDRVEVQALNLTAASGDFSGLTYLAAGFIAPEAGQIAPVPIAWALAPQGFGTAIAGQSWGNDVLPVLQLPEGTCGTALLTLGGTAPAEDVTFDATLDVKIFLVAGFGL